MRVSVSVVSGDGVAVVVPVGVKVCQYSAVPVAPHESSVMVGV